MGKSIISILFTVSGIITSPPEPVYFTILRSQFEIALLLCIATGNCVCDGSAAVTEIAVTEQAITILTNTANDRFTMLKFSYQYLLFYFGKVK